MQNRDIKEVVELRHGIFDLAMQEIHRTVSVDPRFPSQLHGRLSEQLARQAVDKADEMLGPMLTAVRAANLNPIDAELALSEHGFSGISRCWEQFMSARCAALGCQLQDAHKLIQQGIIDVVILDGDPHNGAYQPLKLTIESAGTKQDFFYKTVDPVAMRMVHKTTSVLCQRLSIDIFVDDATTSTNHSYIRPFTPVTKPEGKKELEQYFYVFGAVCSVASFLEISDLHFENFVATKTGPKIIDIEFLLSNTQYQKSKWSYKNAGLFEPAFSPIAQTSWHRHIEPKYCVSKEGISYSHSNPKYCDSHILHDNLNKAINTLDYVQNIEAGVRDADVVLRGLAASAPDFFAEIISRDHKIRCWVRGTAYYRILQLQLWLPQKSWAEKVEATRAKLLNLKSFPATSSQAIREKIVEAEIHDLIQGDVPYFWVDGKTGNLMHSTGLIWEKFGLSTSDALQRQASAWGLRKFGRNMRPIVNRMFSNAV